MAFFLPTQVKVENLGNIAGAWNLDETSGTKAYDNSENQNTGIVTGTTIVTGIFGKARLFNGSSDYISVLDSPVLNPLNISLELWINTNGQTGAQTLIDKRSGTGGYAITLSGSSFPLDLNFIIKDSGGTSYTVTAAAKIANNTDYHIVVVYDSENQMIYIDGLLIVANNIGFVNHNASTSVLTFGANVGGVSGFYKGILDEIRIFYIALSQIDVTDKFNADITSIITDWEIDRTNGEAAHMAKINTTTNVFIYVSQLQSGYFIRIWRQLSSTPQDELVLNGLCNAVEKSGAIVSISAYSKMIELVKRNFSHTYLSTDGFAGKPSAIAMDIISTYGKLNADVTTIQDSGTSSIQGVFQCTNVAPFDRVKALSDSLNWQLYYRDDTDFVYFEPRGFTKNVNTLTVGSEILEMPKWNTDTTEMINNMIVSGAAQDTSTTETFTASAGQTVFTLGFPSLNPSVTVNGTLKTGGLPNATTGQDYNIDIIRAQIVFLSAMAGGETVVVDYSYSIPNTVIKSDANSRAQFTTYSKPLQFDDVVSISDAESRINQLLPKYSKKFNNTTLKVRPTSILGLIVGQAVNCVDTFQNVNLQLEINKHVIRYPSKWDEITVGDREWQTSQWQAKVEESIKRLQEQSQTNMQAYLQVEENTLHLKSRIDTQWINKRVITPPNPNIFVLSDPNFGILGTSTLGDTTGLPPLDASNNIFQIQNRDDIFRCYFNSMSYFNDTTVSTGTWDTVLNQLTFTVGQIIQTKRIQYNPTHNILNVLLFVPIITGIIKYEATNDDGSHWETITPNVTHTFVSTGQILKLKITENGGGSASVKVFIKVTSGY